MEHDSLIIPGGQVVLLRIAERCIVALLDLLQFKVVAQFKQRPLNIAHLLHFAHHIIVDAIHDFLIGGRKKSISKLRIVSK